MGISSTQNVLRKQECSSWISLNLGGGKDWDSCKVFLCGILDSCQAVCQPDMAALFFKKTFDKSTSIKRRICGMSEHFESLGCLKILSFTFQPQWLFLSVFLISFRSSKGIQKYSVMSCVFNQECLDETINPQFSSRVKLLKDLNRVLCCFCQYLFALSNIGKQALESHINSDKHKRNASAKVPSISLHFKKPTAPSKTCSQLYWYWHLYTSLLCYCNYCNWNKYNSSVISDANSLCFQRWFSKGWNIMGFKSSLKAFFYTNHLEI